MRRRWMEAILCEVGRGRRDRCARPGAGVVLVLVVDGAVVVIKMVARLVRLPASGDASAAGRLACAWMCENMKQ